MLYELLGFINVALIVALTAPYWLRMINKVVFKNKNKEIVKLIKPLRKLHKPMGLTILVLAPLHGYLALGGLRPHTGSLVGIMATITIILGGSYFFTKKKAIFKWHKMAALITVILLAVHLLFPSALYTLFKIY
ncbi:MAG: hypothetical protein BGO41_05225 [Clostridiales bacterium 38-18]|nr:MAG: hypothetical protein BGO41_05225 [Clostridiales bacterium 38-18]